MTGAGPLASGVYSGLICLNAATTTSEIHLTLGGMKKSGNSHRELGRKAIEECSEDKSACISFQLEAH